MIPLLFMYAQIAMIFFSYRIEKNGFGEVGEGKDPFSSCFEKIPILGVVLLT